MTQSHAASRPWPLTLRFALALMVASLIAIGAAWGVIPNGFALPRPGGTPAGIVAAGQTVHAEGQSVRSTTLLSCTRCGVVEAVRQVELKGEPVLLASSGGYSGSIVGHQFGRRSVRGTSAAGGEPYFAVGDVSATSYRITVRMDDGTTRTIYQASAPAFGVGAKVKVVNGGLVGRG